MEEKALQAVYNSTGETYPNVRAALLALAENGAFLEYDGEGWFSDLTHQVHIDELTDSEISRILIKSYR